MVIRPVQRTDHEQWLPLWDGYNAFYGRKGATAVPADVTDTTWSRFFDETQPIYALVADHDGQLVGIAHFLFHLSTTHVEPICYLRDLFTLEAERGKGVGRALIEEVCRRARQVGSRQVYWQTHETNLTAMKLYDRVAEKSGFVVYRRTL